MQRGATPALCISLKKGVSFKTSTDQRFVKQGYFLYPGTKYRGGGGENPLTIHEVSAAE